MALGREEVIRLGMDVSRSSPWIQGQSLTLKLLAKDGKSVSLMNMWIPIVKSIKDGGLTTPNTKQIPRDLLLDPVELQNLRYTEFYGDGDSKSYSKVKHVYKNSGIEVQKEFIPH